MGCSSAMLPSPCWASRISLRFIRATLAGVPAPKGMAVVVRYRRSFLPGATFFFTVTLADRRSDLLVRHIGALREAFRAVRQEHPFRVEAIVILPDHLHSIWSLPEGDSDYPGRWRRIKSRFSRTLALQGVPLAKDERGAYALWQRRYWEHTIRSDADRRRHVDYTHYNPVKHGLVRRVTDWPFSSFHRYVRIGLLPPDWGGCAAQEGGHFGERA